MTKQDKVKKSDYKKIQDSALNWLARWQGEEKELVWLIETAGEDVGKRAQAIERALDYFEVKRNFSIKSEDKRKCYSFIYDAAKKSAKESKKSSISAVASLEKKLYGKFKKHLTSASSKLIWLFTQKNPIYDSLTREALYILARRSDASSKRVKKEYEEFFNQWSIEYKNNKPAIKKICEDLSKSMTCYYGKKLPFIKKEWFWIRVFDKYLMHVAKEAKAVKE